ncbi:MAG: acyl--CoA ligase, partial [Alphaproteobacteria bacterium]|nr:acyl--CoA ligase [Alphaproteobacteria bacterium]
MNLAALLHRTARHHGALPAVFWGDRPMWRFDQLGQRMARLAGALGQGLGLMPGSRVALVMTNCPAYVELLYAIWHAGLVAVPVNAKLHVREFAFILDNSGAHACFATTDLVDGIAKLRPELPSLKRLIAVPSPDYDRLLTHDPIPVVERAADHLAWLFYTSGTTGRPKGAMLSHCNLLTMALCYHADVDTISPGDGLLHAAPMSHGSGVYMVPHIAQGSAQIIPVSGKFDAAEILALADIHKGMAMFAAPTMVKRLVDFPATATARTDGLKT